MKANIVFEDLSIRDYKETWDYQEKIHKTTVDTKLAGNTSERNYKVLLVEHPHVYTLGKSGDEQNLLLNAIQLQAAHAQFYKINRGGDITYHGPGQLVGYPIIDLDSFAMGIRDYIFKLEESIIKLISHYGIKGTRLEGATGVWLDIDKPGNTRKICAIGVRCSRSVTMHGFALNANTDLKYFDYINPCGFTDKRVTSIAKETGKVVYISKLKAQFQSIFQDTFSI